MIHDSRIVPLDGRPHLPAAVRRLLGDSRGHWDGNTLVVETTNFSDKTNVRGSGEQLRLIERFTRADAKTLLYEFTVDDPASFVKPWTRGPADGEDRRSDLRVRLPRGELRDDRHPSRRTVSRKVSR